MHIAGGRAEVECSSGVQAEFWEEEQGDKSSAFFYWAWAEKM